MKVIVLYNGEVLWFPSGEFITSCEINAFYLPFDHQNCPVIVTNRGSTAEYHNLTAYNTKPKFDEIVPNNEWTLLDANATEKYIQMQGYTEPHVTFTLRLKRQSSYYVVTMILPIMGLSIVGLMVFLLPPDSGEKISLSVTCMMAFFISQLSITEHLPSSWNRMPILGKFLQLDK